MKHIKTFSQVNESLNEGSGLKLFIAGFTPIGDDEWVWQGLAVAPNKAEAKKLLVGVAKEAKQRLTAFVDGDRLFTSSIMNKKVEAGLYDTTNFDSVLKGKVKPFKHKDLVKKISKYEVNPWKGLN